MMASMKIIIINNYNYYLVHVVLLLLLLFSNINAKDLQCTSDCGSPTTDESRCFRQRDLVTQPDQYTPECTVDGYYKPVQCHSGYCWCSTIEGRPVSGTAVKLPLTPRCQQSRTNRRRESKPFKRKQYCSQSDRTAFNVNLVDIFRSELRRINNDTSDSAKVVAWKFLRLDVNGDSRLGKKELRFLRRMLSKVVEPKHCAKVFFSYCDSDSSGSIDRAEWQICLGVSGSDLSLRLFMSLSKSQSEATKIQSTPPFTALKPASNEKDDEEEEEQNNQTDCTSVRNQALKEDGAFGVFVPSCDDKGNFQEVQCFKSLCWCVWIRSGKPIRGSVIKMDNNNNKDERFNNKKPDCEGAKKSAKAYKGCSTKRKSKFLEIIIEKLIKEYQNETKRVYLSQGEETKWKFSKLDANRNGVLEPIEWRQWRKELKNISNSKLRKCGRNFLRYCDSDSNKKITINEFQDCLKSHKYSSKTHQKPFSSKGPNPFISILKSD